MKSGDKIIVDSHFGRVACKILHPYEKLVHVRTRMHFDFFVERSKISKACNKEM